MSLQSMFNGTKSFVNRHHDEILDTGEAVLTGPAVAVMEGQNTKAIALGVATAVAVAVCPLSIIGIAAVTWTAAHIGWKKGYRSGCSDVVNDKQSRI